MKIIFFLFYLIILTCNVLSANESDDITQSITNIYDINLDDFCPKRYQVNKRLGIENGGFGCKDENGQRHGIWIDRSVDEYRHGKHIRLIFGADNSAEMNNISILSLIVTPEKYHGKKVRIGGFYISDGREDFLLYNTHVQAQCNSVMTGIYLQLPEFIPWKIALEKFNNKYIYIEGVFSSSRGMFGMFAGKVTDINRMNLQDKQPVDLNSSGCKITDIQE